MVHSWAVWPPQKNMDEAVLLLQLKELLAAVPKMFKRRLTPLAKTVFCAVLACTDKVSQPSLVFSSTHGELAKSLIMMQEIEAGEEISPTAFSLSVHNAIAGLFSIAFNNKKQCTVLAAGEEGLATAFIEALGLFNEGEQEVLVVFYDEALPNFFPYAPYKLTAKTSALALKLTQQGEGQKIQFSQGDMMANEGEQAIQLPLLIDFLAGSSKNLDINTARHSWHWQKQHD